MKQSGVVSDDFKRAESHDCPISTCAAPAGSPCRTGKGKVANPIPHRPLPSRAPTRQGPERADPRHTQAGVGLDRAAPADERRRRTGRARPPRIRPRLDRPTVLDAQLDSLSEAGVTRVFSEKISTRATRRPELEAAVKLAGEIRSSGVAVTLGRVLSRDQWVVGGRSLIQIIEARRWRPAR
jgi:hypothetical protein